MVAIYLHSRNPSSETKPRKWLLNAPGIDSIDVYEGSCSYTHVVVYDADSRSHRTCTSAPKFKHKVFIRPWVGASLQFEGSLQSWLHRWARR